MLSDIEVQFIQSGVADSKTDRNNWSKVQCKIRLQTRNKGGGGEISPALFWKSKNVPLF